MIALVVLLVLVVVVGLAAFARYSSNRAERRSVQSYERTLDLLGDVSKRSEQAALVPQPGEEASQAHVRPSAASSRLRPASKAVRPVPSPRVRLQPPAPPGVEPFAPAPPGRTRPVFDVDAEAEEGLVGVSPAPELSAPVVDVTSPALGPAGGALPEDEELDGGPPTEAIPVFDDAAGGVLLPSATGRQLRGLSPHREHVVRRAATGAAAAVVLGALAAGGYELASGHHGTPGATGSTSPPATTAPPASKGSGGSTGGGHHSGHSGTSTPTSSTTHATTPSTLQPTSSSSSLVAYEVPEQSYHVTFDVTGSSDCWIGVQQRQGGPYLWMDTLQPGATYTYQASGAIVVRIGAPPQLSIQVNGKRVALPASNVNAYDVTLTPNSQTST